MVGNRRFETRMFHYLLIPHWSLISCLIALLFDTSSSVALNSVDHNSSSLPAQVVDTSTAVHPLITQFGTVEVGITPTANLSTNESALWPTNCTVPAIAEFPSDGFSKAQRRHGWLLIHAALACYCFWFLAVICGSYLIPAIEQISSRINLPEDVIGATFMAAATSCPELFINCIGTFVTKGDLGVGTIVGSAVFNILAVPACCGFFAGQSIPLDWWPITRDCMMYFLAVLGLVVTLYDGIVMWYEALFLTLAYFAYISAMYWNDGMARKARTMISKMRRKLQARPFREVREFTPLLRRLSPIIEKENCTSVYTSPAGNASVENLTNARMTKSHVNEENGLPADPCHRRGISIVEFLLKWPITFVLWITIPDSRLRPKWRLVTLLMSMAWIGVISYAVAFLITIIGDTLDIPDSVMGLTILAAGMSIPEAVSSIIVSRQGHGALAISNSIGSNTFDILLCLGIPWFVKAFFVPADSEHNWVVLNSSGLTYSAVSLLITLFGLYIIFAANKFHLNWKVGLSCSVMYLGFLAMASMIELNVFFNVNLPICPH